MFISKSCVLIFLFIISSLAFAAKPTDDEILKQITRPNMQEVKLSSTGGTFSTYNLQHWWTRGVTYKMDAGIKEFPNAKVIVGAEARYRIVGENYDFDKLKTAWSAYEGIPTPPDSEIISILKKDLPKFVQSYIWNSMVGELKGPLLSKDPKVRNIEWHTANSFSIHVQAEFSVIVNNTQVQDKWVDYEVRFYRDSVTKPWKQNFVSSKSKEKILATHTYSSDEINAMPTAASLDAERNAQAEISDLPSITIPEFSSDKDAMAFIYQQLRTGNKKQVEALFRSMASSDFYVEGSKIRLNRRGKETLEKLIKQSFDNKISFAKSYCPQLYVQSYQTNMINIVDALKKNKTRIALVKSGGHYERGKKVGQAYKISALEVWTLRTDDEVAQLKSWPFEELCAETGKTFKQLKTSYSTSTPPSSTSSTSVTATKNKPKPVVAHIQNPSKSWKWSQFTSKYLPISMKVIGSPGEKQKMSNGYLATTMNADSNMGSFQMVATDYKQKITAEIANPTHIKFAKNFVKSNNALIHKKQSIKFGTGSAQDYLIERGNGEQKVKIRFRIFSHGTVVYQVIYTQYKSRFDNKIADQFIESITLK